MNSFLIGEVGLSHEGSLGIAMSMATKCKEIGLNAVKFQMHYPEYESTGMEIFRVTMFPQDSSRREYWTRTSFTKDEWIKLINHCREISIDFLCTPFSVQAAELLLHMDVKKVKIASGDFENQELLNFCVENFEEIYLSTGFSLLREISSKIAAYEEDLKKLVFMQCTSKYPTPIDETGLQMANWFKSKGVKFGLSDHSGNLNVSKAAIAIGFQAIEFHVVYSKEQFGPDSQASLTFKEAECVAEFNALFPIANSLDYSKDQVSTSLNQTRRLFGRGLALKENMKSGSIVTERDLTLKKPEGAFTWEHRNLFVGKRLNRDLSNDVHITLNDFD